MNWPLIYILDVITVVSIVTYLCFLYKTREQFLRSSPRTQVIAQIAREAPLYAGKEILLCFTCDPYQSIETEHKITRQTLEIFTRHNIRARILTKAGMGSVIDVALMKENRAIYGATLTFVDDVDSRYYEPYAALPWSRFEALKIAKEAGLETWVSLEPVISPEQSIEIIHLTHEYVDVYKVGKWNHDKKAKDINWRDFGIRAKEVLQQYGKNYYIKRDLAVFLNG